jgi:hypothetical protein
MSSPQKPISAPVGRPQTLWLCFDAHAADGRVWAIRAGRMWLRAAVVETDGVEWATIYRGPRARQPRAYLRGTGYVIRRADGRVTLAGWRAMARRARSRR